MHLDKDQSTQDKQEKYLNGWIAQISKFAKSQNPLQNCEMTCGPSSENIKAQTRRSAGSPQARSHWEVWGMEGF